MPAPVKTLIWHGCALGPYKHTVGGHVTHIPANGIFQAGTGAHHDHQHEYAPENPKSSEKGSYLILSQGAEDLLPTVCIKYSQFQSFIGFQIAIKALFIHL